MYVFRDGRRKVSGNQLTSSLADAFCAIDSDHHGDDILSAIVAAGELEAAIADCAAADQQWRSSRERAERLTDAAASMLIGERACDLEELAEAARAIALPESLEIAVHEGFAFYALHPMKIVALVDHHVSAAHVAVVGLRSIGAALSAVVARSAARRGARVERTSVRPTGHPYDRKLDGDAEFASFIERNRDAQFVIVDEGPGLSGSSFLSVAEAIEQAGIDRERILLLGSRAVRGPELQAPQAAERWIRFKFVATAAAPLMPQGALIGIAGGEWRRHFLERFDNQPASWTQLESAKFLSADKQTLYKFEGFGHFGQEIGRRSARLAELGFGAPYFGNTQGFGVYRVVAGRMLTADDVSAEVLARIANYCAARAREFRADDATSVQLEEMLRWNWHCEFDRELSTAQSRLRVEVPVIADARMMPHEWLRTSDAFIKLDAASHGDDHFFPGPCDIAWDIAGTIVEWSLTPELEDQFVCEYERQSGDAVRPRLANYVRAYATFRMAWSKMAAQVSREQFDEALLTRDYNRYKALCQQLDQRAAAPPIAVMNATTQQPAA